MDPDYDGDEATFRQELTIMDRRKAARLTDAQLWANLDAYRYASGSCNVRWYGVCAREITLREQSKS